MTIVVPITPVDVSLASKSIRWASGLIGFTECKLLLVPRVSTAIDPIYNTARSFFQSVHVLPTHQLGYDNIWQDVHSHFKRTESTDPWFWWQFDYTLLRPDAWPLILANGIRSDLTFGQPQSPKEFLSRQLFHAGEPDFRIPIHVGCKDGSLIEQLTAERNSPEVNVPGHAMTYYEPKIETPPGTVDILIVTYKKDFPWLEYCLRAIQKFGTGFREVIVQIPEGDLDALEEVFDKAEVDERFDMYPYVDAPPGKGFVMHAAKICQADLITDADFILHMDADCIIKEPCDAGNYFENGKPVMVWRPYESLKGPKLSGVVSDCYQWKLVSEQTLGMPLHAYTMCRHPTMFPREIYKPFREQVERTQGEPFEQWFCKQKNDHPQGVAEFPSLGGFCYERYRDLFTWVDCMHTAPRDLLQNFWSHGGLDHHIGEGWLNGNKVDNNAQKTMTARQWIESKLAL